MLPLVLDNMRLQRGLLAFGARLYHRSVNAQGYRRGRICDIASERISISCKRSCDWEIAFIRSSIRDLATSILLVFDMSMIHREFSKLVEADKRTLAALQPYVAFNYLLLIFARTLKYVYNHEKTEEQRRWVSKYSSTSQEAKKYKRGLMTSSK